MISPIKTIRCVWNLIQLMDREAAFMFNCSSSSNSVLPVARFITIIHPTISSHIILSRLSCSCHLSRQLCCYLVGDYQPCIHIITGEPGTDCDLTFRLRVFYLFGFIGSCVILITCMYTHKINCPKKLCFTMGCPCIMYDMLRNLVYILGH